MHQPLPYGYFGQPVDGVDAAFVEALARRVTNLRQVGEIENLRITRALPMGGSVSVIAAGGVRKVIVTKPQHTADSEDAGGDIPLDVPMLFSGVVERAVLRAGEKTSIRITKETQRRLARYCKLAPGRKGGCSPQEYQELDRFVIPYGQRFQEFVPDGPPGILHTQYARLRPTWYSGAMAQVVQLVGGYGKTKFDTRPSNSIELATLAIPEDVRRTIAAELKDYRLMCSTGKPPADGQIKYDYKFHECHGVAFGADKKPWLVRIGVSGVFAMPLPLIPATTTAAFRSWIQKVGDSEILWALERFGGLPSGEGFPTREKAVKAWERAGVIIKLCDTSDFYEHIAYSSAMGWSFNTSGSQAYNTCFDYDEGEGVAYGLMYSLNINIGSLKAVEKEPPPPAYESSASGVAKYTSRVMGLARADVVEGPAVIYKLRQATFRELAARARVGANYESEYEYWVNRKLVPVAAASGSMTEVSRGWLHHGAKFFGQPQIKFPEPMLGYCLSHDFRPLIQGITKNPLCDTVIYAYYIGDDLKTAKYFHDPRPAKNEGRDDFTDCMIVGSWTRVTNSGKAALFGNFHTSDFDARKTLSEKTTTTTIVGKDLGFSSTPGFAFDNPFERSGSLYRNRSYDQTTTITTDTDSSLAVGLCVPFYCRDGLLHAVRQTTSGGVGSGTTVLSARRMMQDPTSYRFWTHHNVYAWRGGIEVMNGVPRPVDGAPVWVEVERRGDFPCSDFADAGAWISGLPADYTWLIHPNSNEWLDAKPPEDPPYKMDEVSVVPGSGAAKDDRSLDISIAGMVGRVPTGVVDTGYFFSSPSEMGSTFSRGATRVCAGASEYTITTEGPTSWGYARLADRKNTQHFIGVINE